MSWVLIYNPRKYKKKEYRNNDKISQIHDLLRFKSRNLSIKVYILRYLRCSKKSAIENMELKLTI